MVRDRGRTISVLGYGLALTLVLASLLNLARALDLFGAPPVRGDGQDFVEFLLQVAAFDHDRVVIYDATSLLFGIGFLALAAVGVVLWRRGEGNGGTAAGGRRLLTAAFVVAGTLGVAAQLADIGVTAVAANPTYCDCGYLAEEIVGRLQAVDTGFHISGWLRDGALLIAAAGFALLAINGPRRAMDTGRWLALAAAALLIVYVLTEIADLGMLTNLILLAATLIVIPAWAVLLARRPADEPLPA